jgi:molecular chaperone DnaK (HSP70)
MDRATALPHPSVVWYPGAEVVVGRRAKQQLADQTIGVVGDVVRSPKRYLGTGETFSVAGIRRTPADVVAEIIAYLKRDAEERALADVRFEHAVVTIPVGMDGRARRELRDAVLRGGMRIVQFVHEPLAALYAYLRRQADYSRTVADLEDELLLVFDWGGGTLDLTLCTVAGGTLTQIANLGTERVGGDRFDDLLRNEVRRRHAEQHGITTALDVLPGAEAKLIEECEHAKIELSTRASWNVFVANYLRSDGPERTLEVPISRNDLETLARPLVDEGIGAISALLGVVHREPASLALCLATGGMIQMPYIRQRLLEIFGALRLPEIDGGNRIIAEGAAWIAHDERRLRLAKPFEVLLADDSYAALVSEKTDLPTEGRSHVQPFGMYCVDPRDGFARFQFARPRWPGRAQKTDDRISHGTLVVGVDPSAEPLLERLEMKVEIDHDLVVSVDVASSLFGDTDRFEIHDLEFGINLGSVNGA